MLQLMERKHRPDWSRIFYDVLREHTMLLSPRKKLQRNSYIKSSTVHVY